MKSIALKLLVVACLIATSCGASSVGVEPSETAAAPQTPAPQATAIASAPAVSTIEPTPTAEPATSTEPEPSAIESAEPIREPISLSGNARFDQLVIETHASSETDLDIETFHQAIDYWCSGLWADLETTVGESIAALIQSNPEPCSLWNTDRYPDGGTGLDGWSEIVDFRWARVVSWGDHAAFEAAMEGACAPNVLALSLEGLGLSTYDEILSLRFSGECRYLDGPEETSVVTQVSTEETPSTEASLSGTILFRNQSKGISAFDVDSRTLSRIQGQGGLLPSAAFTPAGDILVFARRFPGNEDLTGLWMLDLRSGTCALVTHLDGRIGAIEWAQDGSRFAVEIWDRQLRTEVIDVVDRDLVRRTIVDEADGAQLAGQAWIDDASVVVGLLEERSTTWEIRDVDSGDAVLLAAANGRSAAVVSPDGETLIATKRGGLLVVNGLDDLEASAMDLATGIGEEKSMVFSPDGQSVAYETQSGPFLTTGVYVIDLESPTERLDIVPNELLEVGETLWAPSIWAPNGDGLLVGLGTSESVGPQTNSYFSLDGQRIDLGFKGKPFAWLPDGLGDFPVSDCKLP